MDKDKEKGFSKGGAEEEKTNFRPGLRELFMSVASLFNIAEEEVHTWTRKFVEKEGIRPEEKSKLIHEIWQRQKEATALIEQWIEDRVRRTLRALPNPFQKELRQLQKRVELLGERVQRLSNKLKR